MAKRMSDDEIMDYTYNKLFGDLDDIQSGSMFSGDKEATDKVTPNAAGMEGVEISIKPLMAAAEEGAKQDDDEEDEDKLKGIGNMSPLMEQLHGKR